MDTEPTNYSHETTYVIQRLVALHDKTVWVAASMPYYGDEGEKAATDKCDQMREIFGTGKVRVVRRDTIITQTVVED